VTQTTVACDMCGAPIEAGRTKLVVQCGILSPATGDGGIGLPAVDLCPTCREALEAWFSGGQQPPGGSS
jgi:hypothetical protein